jgi:hypothetical protein
LQLFVSGSSDTQLSATAHIGVASCRLSPVSAIGRSKPALKPCSPEVVCLQRRALPRLKEIAASL